MAMSTRLRSLSLLVMVGAAVGLATYSVKASPQAGPAQDPLSALLAEVHGLRLAIEQSSTVAPRVQLTLARLNIEEQRVAQLSGQLDQVRRELSVASLELQKVTDELPDLEKAVLTATDDRMRQEFERAQVEMKRQLARRSRLVQELRARENEAAQTLNTEQGRWMDVNARLDELERLLGPVPR
jgi:predicted  nucleic acid-binding Zn-ribbon protein